MYYVHINTNTCMYIFKILFYIKHLYIIYKNININVFKSNYFQNIDGVCIYTYTHDKYIEYT